MHFYASYLSAAKFEKACEGKIDYKAGQRFEPETDEAFVEALRLSMGCDNGKRFSAWDNAVQWIRDNIAAGKSVYASGKIYLVEEIEARCDDCECEGLRFVHQWTIPADGPSKYVRELLKEDHCRIERGR